MSAEDERRSDEELAGSFADDIKTDFEADEVAGVEGDTTGAEAGAKGTADAIRSLMSSARDEVNLDSAAIRAVAGDFAAWDELHSRRGGGA
ncbi:MAG: hypothetical protein MR874_04295 [Coriobacteriaceae bacterium]|uniref:hypothetical protein n=1 Tax=Tractidigestivibacter sp. TaxID=2847320 RepID=UPI002A91157B|nr:hypothetical protein [Tractidigestivibacter sp.]MCI6843963.1 hypothetical protein [Coriobacteriaceae bacterium]MDD7584962.1 hypothetical protein [Coriobacteriaceae bacterium]MDY5271296.1 hypothetical protein [Tractidigestivibacter sp.]